jgi:hypothetical protein
MKYIWEAGDIRPGRYYYRHDKGCGADMGYLASVTHKIGFRADATAHDDETGRRYIAISITDGCVCQPHTKQEFADMLNDGQYVPLRTERLLEIILHCKNQNEGE